MNEFRFIEKDNYFVVRTKGFDTIMPTDMVSLIPSIKYIKIIDNKKENVDFQIRLKTDWENFYEVYYRSETYDSQSFLEEYFSEIEDKENVSTQAI